MMESKRVLVVVRPADTALVSAVLQGHFDIIVRHTLQDAVGSLDESLGLIVCGVHFDHGAMFDLLAAVKSHASANTVPFFLVLRAETHYSKRVIEGIRSASAIRGVDAFIDLRELMQRMDEQEMFDNLRKLVREVLDLSN